MMATRCSVLFTLLLASSFVLLEICANGQYLHQSSNSNDRSLTLDKNTLTVHEKSILSTAEQEHLSDVGNATPPANSVSFFWHIPKSGGTSLKDFVVCLGLLTVAEHAQMSGIPASLDVVDQDYINVDVTTVAGIHQAVSLGLLNPSSISNKLNSMVVATPLFQPAIEFLFTSETPGSLFVLLRHPIERATSLFYYLQHASWEPTYAPELQNVSLLEYYTSPQQYQPEENWMTRMLVNNRHESLVQNDLDHAKMILEQKAVIGLTSHLEDSLRRFGMYFGWKELATFSGCIDNFSKAKSNSYHHPKLSRTSQEWEVLSTVNAFDMELYEHAMDLFEKQASLFLNN